MIRLNKQIRALPAISALLALSLLTGCNDLGGILNPGPSATPTPGSTSSPQASASPTSSPSSNPSASASPTAGPTVSPSAQPTTLPTANPTAQPSSPSGSSQPVSAGFVDQPVNSVLVPSKFVMPTSALSGSGNGNLSLSKNYFKPGKSIALNFIAGSGFASSAWIGILPANIPHGDENVNDQNDLTFQALKTQSSGQLSFIAPNEEKAYDFRMNGADNGGPEAASVGFVVTRELPPEETAVSKLNLSRDHFKPGKPIMVKFSAPASFDDNAWIGIVPASVAHGEEITNDQNDVGFEYLRGRISGDMTFTAPMAEGTYDLRMQDNDNGGKEACYATFIVTRELPAAEIAASSLSLAQTNFARGAKISLNFTAAASFDENAWIGIVPSEVAHGEETLNDTRDLTFQQIKNRTSGTMEFVAPSQPGRYDFRMNDTDANGKEVTYLSFTVSD